MTAILWAVIPLVVMVGLYRMTFRIESHWASKDGRRFVCQVHPIGAPGAGDGRPRETRVIVQPDGCLTLSRRRDAVSEWRVVGRAPTAPKHRAVYVLRPTDGSPDQLAMRLPDTSRAVPVLDGLLALR